MLLFPIAVGLAVATVVPAPTKVAFIADHGYSEATDAVFRLVRDEGASLLVIQGDLDYKSDPKKWEEKINRILGENFPVLASPGDEEFSVWEDYQAVFRRRLAQTKEVSCSGDLGVRSTCAFRNIRILLLGVGLVRDGFPAYIRDPAVHGKEPWKICSWHYNQRLLQVEKKSDDAGWDAYEACREIGAIVANGHAHVYSRTHLLSKMNPPTVLSTEPLLILAPGQTFVAITGLGGKSIRKQKDKLAANPWWASVYTSKQNGDFGALFCSFGAEEKQPKAECYFKDIQGLVVDRFELKSLL
jgi:hypothetical protein